MTPVAAAAAMLIGRSGSLGFRVHSGPGPLARWLRRPRLSLVACCSSPDRVPCCELVETMRCGSSDPLDPIHTHSCHIVTVTVTVSGGAFWSPGLSFNLFFFFVFLFSGSPPCALGVCGGETLLRTKTPAQTCSAALSCLAFRSPPSFQACIHHARTRRCEMRASRGMGEQA